MKATLRDADNTFNARTEFDKLFGFIQFTSYEHDPTSDTDNTVYVRSLIDEHRGECLNMRGFFSFAEGE